MYFANSSSMIIHYPDCRHVARIKRINLTGYERLDNAGKKGYRLCKCCDPMSRKVQPYEAEMETYCRENKYRFRVIYGQLIINTPFSQWKVYAGTNGGYDLYHKNTQGCIKNYHLQRSDMKDPMAILKYINCHDNYRLEHPLPTLRKTPPRKGSRRYYAEVRKAEKARKRDEVKRVLTLIDAMAAV